MTEPKKPQLPIGYWLKKADEVITARINAAQQTNGLSRTDWQVLNFLHQVGSVNLEKLAEPMRPFADVSALADVVFRLTARGLIEEEGTATIDYRLTDQGRRMHETALILQKEVRQQAIYGVSEVDYTTTVRVLQQLVENLGGEGVAQQDAPRDAPKAARPRA